MRFLTSKRKICRIFK